MLRDLELCPSATLVLKVMNRDRKPKNMCSCCALNVFLPNILVRALHFYCSKLHSRRQPMVDQEVEPCQHS